MRTDEQYVYFTYQEAHLFNPKLQGDEYRPESSTDWYPYVEDFLYPNTERGQFSSETTGTEFRRPLQNWTAHNPHFL